MKYQIIVRTQSGITKELRNSKTDNLLTISPASEGYVSKAEIAKLIAAGDFERFDLNDSIKIEAV